MDLMAAADRDDVRDALAEVAEHTSLLRVLGLLPRRPASRSEPQTAVGRSTGRG